MKNYISLTSQLIRIALCGFSLLGVDASAEHAAPLAPRAPRPGAVTQMIVPVQVPDPLTEETLRGFIRGIRDVFPPAQFTRLDGVSSWRSLVFAVPVGREAAFIEALRVAKNQGGLAFVSAGARPPLSARAIMQRANCNSCHPSAAGNPRQEWDHVERVLSSASLTPASLRARFARSAMGGVMAPFSREELGNLIALVRGD